MEISFTLDRFKSIDSKRIMSARAELIGNIVEEINRERVGTKWKPVSARQIAVKCSHIKDLFTLGWLYKESMKCDSFGKCFYGKLKTKK